MLEGSISVQHACTHMHFPLSQFKVYQVLPAGEKVTLLQLCMFLQNPDTISTDIITSVNVEHCGTTLREQQRAALFA